MPFSLYIHIPYCHSKCPYCDFNSHAASSWPEQAYTDALIAEMRARAAEPNWSGGRVKTIFFGGGTPSLFAPRSIGALIDAAAAIFGVEADAEITLEANPGTVDSAKLAGFRIAGVNRISFGAQSFNPAILKFLGRLHSAEETRAAARAVRRAGFARLNLDLIFAVPGQTAADVLNDIAEVVALEPDHVSAYNLTFEEGTVFFAERKRGRIRELSNDAQAAIFSTVRHEIPRRGYPMYEISNYAAPGHEARHNLTYWHAESYLGLGAGAHSFAQSAIGGRRWWNEKAPSRYIELVRANKIAEVGGETIDRPAAMSEFVFLNLRLRDGFAIAEFERRFGQPLDDSFAGVSRRLVEDGLLISRGGRVFLSDRGVELGDSVFAEFV
ncbi:MAG TPA: radical SAM family heme chaperone HemW [Candidatus Binataceae bacterium]|nr:radical SAM family heme chaperone HemW [Candidatus Binataceae bacterium]